MENLIYQKIKEYDIKMNSFTISFTGRPLLIDDLISLYRFRNAIAKKEDIKKLTQQIHDDFCKIKEQSHENIKFVTTRYDGISRIFFFSEDYSKIFSDFIFP
ncbi:hypothetical protein BBI01_06100 [Chryseobacterium artocarpi]|uniref:Uncharacterized protein n=2 Tax=Chryseobacterium TaxID=59732 RepID=A0A1N7P3Y4_9FLAO|nr:MULTISPECIES: hypothetical protein [Chryseobacterium]OCA76262.1 hypothetical protein BBI01_06100 [Chryseobacterium artocarpi]SIT05149.1 hypothetical protein SAMN05421786_104346 [Chryseobacterium ureilyticum]